MTGVLIKRGNLDLDTHTRRAPVKKKTGFGVIRLQAKGDTKGCQQTPEGKREAGNRSSLGSLGRDQHLDLGHLAFKAVRR